MNFACTEILSALASAVLPLDLKNLSSDFENNSGGVDCEEVKVFPDSEPILMFSHKKGEGVKNRESIFEMGREASEDEGTTTDKDNSSENSESKPYAPKIGEVVHDKTTSGGNYDGETFMAHPARKIMLDFLRMIIIDWMSSSSVQSQSKSGTTMNLVIDTVLDAGIADMSEGNNCAVGNAVSPGWGPNGLVANPNNAPGSGSSNVATPSAMGAAYSQGAIIQFHTSLLGTLLDHLIAFDLDQVTSYLHSVAHFISRLVDKLWLETFARDPQVVLDFILVLVNHCK